MGEFEMGLRALPLTVRYTSEAVAGLVGKTLAVSIEGGGKVSGLVTAARLDDDGWPVITVATAPNPLLDELLGGRWWGLGDFSVGQPPLSPRDVKPKPSNWDQVPGMLAPSRVEQMLQGPTRQ